MIHAEEVILPLGVNALQHDHGHDVLHQRNAEVFLLAAEMGVDGGGDRPFDLRGAHLPLLLVEIEAQGEPLVYAVVQRLEVPILGMALFVHIIRHDVGDRLLDHPLDVRPEILTAQDLTALLIDNLALLVHHVVEFQKMLPDVEVLAFHAFLGVLDGLGNQAVFNGLVLLDADAVHDGGDLFRPEDPEEVVLQRQIKTG